MNLTSKKNNPLHQNKTFSIITGLSVLLIIAFFLVCKVSEYDIWYHMAMGRQILSSGKLPIIDELCQLNLGRSIQAHLWLFQTLTAAGYAFAGFWWLQAMQILIWGATLFFVYRSTRVWTNPLAAWLFLLVAAIACEERFTIRPEIVSYLMVALFYWRLQQKKFHSAAEITLFVGLQWLWTNSHGLFPIGPFLVGCYLFVALIKDKQTGDQSEIRSLGILAASVSLTCLITPNGFGNIRYAWLLVTSAGPSASEIFKFGSYAMYEMASPIGETSRRLIPFWFYLPLLAAFLISLFAAASYRCRELPFARILIVLAMLATSMTGMRNMPLFAIVAAPLTAELLSMTGSIVMVRACGLAVAAIVGITALLSSPRPALNQLKTWTPYRFGIGLSTDYIPWSLPAFLDKHNFSGPVFNSQTLGGFYEYHGYKKRIPFYDYRLEDYDQNELLKIYKATYSAFEQPAGWMELVQRYGFQGILLENGSTTETAGLLPLISSDPGWRLVYLDYGASFWMRTGQAQKCPYIDRATVKTLVAEIKNAVQAENIDAFLEKSGLFPDVRQELLEKATQQWSNAVLLTDLGVMKMQAGKLNDAEQLFKRVLTVKPDSRVTLTTLAQIELIRGNRTSAIEYLNKALKHYPDDPDLRQNLDAVLNAR